MAAKNPPTPPPANPPTPPTSPDAPLTPRDAALAAIAAAKVAAKTAMAQAKAAAKALDADYAGPGSSVLVRLTASERDAFQAWCRRQTPAMSQQDAGRAAIVAAYSAPAKVAK